MTWERRYRWRQTMRTSLVLWAGTSLAAALIVAPVVRWVDRETSWVLFGFSSEGARAVLGVLVGSMLTFIVFVLSATLIVVQLASGQSTPRVISMVLATRGIRFALGLLTFTYGYTLAALGRVEDRVPDLHVSVAIFLNLLCIVVFFVFVQRLSTGLRPASLILLVAVHARRVIEGVYPRPYSPVQIEQSDRGVLPMTPTQIVALEGRSGVVLAFSASELVRLAADTNAIIEMVPQVGDFIGAGEPLFRVYGDMRPILIADLQGCVAIGPERTVDQDPRFVFRILVDIASKALSPGINDPTTAVQAIDQIQRLLQFLGQRNLDEDRGHNSDGKLRLVYRTPGWTDFVMLAVSEVRQFGGGSLQVDRRLRAMLGHLIATLPEARRPPLKAELDMLGCAIKRNFEDEEDRRRASVADYQGVGGSET